MNINEVHWNFSDNGTKEPAKSRFWNFCNFWTAWNVLMRFSLLCSGEWALSFCICVFFYIGVSLTGHMMDKPILWAVAVCHSHVILLFSSITVSLNINKNGPLMTLLTALHGSLGNVAIIQNQNVVWFWEWVLHEALLGGAQSAGDLTPKLREPCMRKPVFAICEQQRCRSACTSVQSDQHLCYSLLR